MAYKKKPSGWDDIAHWYDGWVGKQGSDHHQKLAIPAILKHINLQTQTLLDIGCGTGVLAPHIVDMDISYHGIDISPRLIQRARQYHGQYATFTQGDARELTRHYAFNSIDAAVFLLSIQDMNPLHTLLQQVANILTQDGQLLILLVHPCFRIPRQSGWGFEAQRKLQYRRIDHYLSPLRIPMKQHKRGTTISFHRPLSTYVNTLSRAGLMIDRLDEIITYQQGKSKAERRAHNEIPLFMLMGARKHAL